MPDTELVTLYMFLNVLFQTTFSDRNYYLYSADEKTGSEKLSSFVTVLS